MIEVEIYGLHITVSKDNIHIKDSYNVELPILMYEILEYLKETLEKEYYTDCNVFKYRTMKSMVNEWTAHNNAYKLGYKKERTGSVDLNYPQPWYASICYWLLSRISL